MPLLFCDSFELASDTTARWTFPGGVVVSTPGDVRTGLRALQIGTGSAPRVRWGGLAGDSRMLISAGFGIKAGALEGVVCQFSNLNAVGTFLLLNADGSLTVQFGSTVVGSTPAGAVPLNSYAYILLVANLTDNTDPGTYGMGFVQVYVNGVLVLDLSNLATAPDNNYVTDFWFVGPTAAFSYVDDLFLWGNALPVAYLVPISIFAILPISDTTVLPPPDGPPVYGPDIGGGFYFDSVETPLTPASPQFSLVNSPTPDPLVGLACQYTGCHAAGGYGYSDFGFDFSGLPVGLDPLSVVGCATLAYQIDLAPAFGSVQHLDVEIYAQDSVTYASQSAGPPVMVAGMTEPDYNGVSMTWLDSQYADVNPLTGNPWLAADLAIIGGPFIHWSAPT